jgi:integrase/recombinase XerC
VASRGWAHSTVRCYQDAVGAFCAYAIDLRYGWVGECERRVGARPSQFWHKDNTATLEATGRATPPNWPADAITNHDE